MKKQLDIYLYGYSGNEDSLQEFAAIFSVGNDYRVLPLPGFSDGRILTPDNQRSILSYARLLSQEVEAVTRGYAKVRIIGHSHGAMLAFALGCVSPSICDEMVLITPVANPRLSVRLFAYMTRISCVIFGTRFTLWLMKRQILTDVVTRYLGHRSWSKEAYRKIARIRREEAQNYNQALIGCMLQPLHFSAQCDTSHVALKTTILYCIDDSVSGRNDHLWFSQRMSTAKVIQAQGGHHVIVAEPIRTAALLQ